MQSRSRCARDFTSRTNPFEKAPLISRYENGLNAKPFLASALRPCITNSALRSTATAEELIEYFAAAALSDLQLSLLESRPRSAPPCSSCFALLSPTSWTDAIASPFLCSAVVPAAVPFLPFPRLRVQVDRRTDAVSASVSASHQLARPSPSKAKEPASPHHPVSHQRNQHSIFRSLTTSPATPTRLQRLSSARLWNPTNSTPRLPSHRRRPSTPTGPPVPLQHPALDGSTNTADPNVTGAGDYPLLTLTEHIQARHSTSTPLSFQFDLNTTENKRISLPGSVRASYDERRSQTLSPTRFDFQTRTSGESNSESPPPANVSGVDKGKGIMLPENEDSRRSYSRDLERGPDVMDHHRFSNVSIGDGIGSAISSSNSSIMGEEIQADLGESWGPQHPCFPHLNPHVPADSAEYAKTRIIRIRRDWLLQGDLAPTFSNLYPEILDPAGVPEPEFRRIIDKLNKELVPAFDPYNLRNVFDAFFGLATGWLWDDFGLTGIKSRLNNLEVWIEKWNREKEKTTSSEDGVLPPKLISLRRTGYMTLDIQIPDPEIAPAPSSTGAGESMTALPLEPAPVLVA
ncbi:hypothetical protein ACHAQJ_007108 [Trichoderma viride]